MRTVLIASGGQYLGLGHWLRCFALAEHLPGPILYSPIAHPILRYAPAKLHLDSYANLSGYLESVNPDLVVVDDPTVEPQADAPILRVTDRPRLTDFRAQWLVNPNPGSVGLHAKHVMAGPKYALLRQDIVQRRKAPTDKPVSRILVALGGSNAAMSMLPYIGRIVRQNAPGTTFVYGGPTGRLHGFGPHKRLWGATRAVLDALASCDVAICPASTTALELACLGIPMCLYVSAENQEAGYTAWTKMGIPAWDGGNGVIALLESGTYRRDVAQLAQKMADGKGAERVATIVKNL